MTHLNRRRFLGVSAGAAGAGLLGISGCGERPGGGGGGATTPVQFTWWGNPDRDKRTKEALDAYRKANGGVVTPQFTGWDGYWEKLATQTAGGQPPDVIQMDYAYLSEYVNRDILEPFDSYIPKTLKVNDWDKNKLDSGRIKGKLYGVNAGVNSMTMICNTSFLEELRQEKPDHTMTWDDFAVLTKRIAKVAPDGVFGTTNALLIINAYECWLRQRGKDLYTADSKLGFTKADLTEWYEYWEDLRKSGAAASAEVQLATGGNLEQSLPVKRKAVFDFAHSNQLNAFSTVSKDTMDGLMYPAGEKPGHYLKASMLFSVAKKSTSKESAVKLVNALLTDPKVAKALGSERGVPVDNDIRTMLEKNLTAPEKKVFDYIAFIEDKVGPTPLPPPQGGTEIDNTIYPFVGEQIAYGKMSIPKAVDRFFTDAEKALS